MARSTGARLRIAMAVVAAVMLIASPLGGARIVAETKVTISRFLPLYHGAGTGLSCLKDKSRTVTFVGG